MENTVGTLSMTFVIALKANVLATPSVMGQRLLPLPFLHTILL